MPRVRIAAIGDLHCREDSAGTYRDAFREIEQKVDVLALLGDLTDRGLLNEAEVLLEELSGLRLPIVAVMGNHDCENDHQADICRMLRERGVCVLDGNTFVYEQAVGFTGVKGFCGGFGTAMLGPWGERVLKDFVHETIDEALRLEGGLNALDLPHRVALLHYAPITATIVGEHPEIFAFLGSSRLVEPIDRYGVDVIFHGHAHHGSPRGTTDRGIPVYNTAVPVLSRSGIRPPFVTVEIDSDAPAPAMSELHL